MRNTLKAKLRLRNILKAKLSRRNSLIRESALEAHPNRFRLFSKAAPLDSTHSSKPSILNTLPNMLQDSSAQSSMTQKLFWSVRWEDFKYADTLYPAVQFFLVHTVSCTTMFVSTHCILHYNACKHTLYPVEQCLLVHCILQYYICKYIVSSNTIFVSTHCILSTMLVSTHCIMQYNAC